MISIEITENIQIPLILRSEVEEAQKTQGQHPETDWGDHYDYNDYNDYNVWSNLV